MRATIQSCPSAFSFATEKRKNYLVFDFMGGT
jgi:hypothetical protein